MATQLNIDGNIIELEENIAYNIQTADIGDFSKLKSNYTSSFNIPKTQQVVRLFEGLGIPSDTSGVPYRIMNVQCLDDYTIVYEGTLVVLETTSLYYKSTVISGVQDLAAILGSRTFYDIGLRLLEKTIANVLNNSVGTSGILPDTVFALADYGGIFYRNGTSELQVNVDNQVQSFSIQYLFDLVMNEAGFSYTLPPTVSTEGEYLTFPLPPALNNWSQRGDRYLRAAKTTAIIDRQVLGTFEIGGYKEWNSRSVDTAFITTNGDWQFRIQTSGTYIISVPLIVGRYREWDVVNDEPTSDWLPLLAKINVNGVEYDRFFTRQDYSSVTNSDQYQTVIQLSSSDILELTIHRDPRREGMPPVHYDLNEAYLEMWELENSENAERTSLGMTLVDFLREFTYKYALMPIQSGTHIDFISYYDIFENWDVVDWSDKYIERTSETYTLDYNQNNWLRHSYVQEGEDEFDLNLRTGNMNRPPTKDLIVSKVFAPSIVQGREVFETFTATVDDNNKVNYGFSNRRFFIRVTREGFTTTRFYSNTMPGSQTVNSRYSWVASYDAAFRDNDRWKAVSRMLSNLRVHNINLHLTTVDMTQVDVSKLYYFEQEQAYYLLSNLQYTKGKETKAQFIKVPCVFGWEAYSQHCEVSGGNNTGRIIVDELVNLASGEIKPNVPSDIDYIAPYFNPCECPSNDFFQIMWLSLSARGENLQFILDEGTNVNRVEVRNTQGAVQSFQENSNINKSIYVPESTSNYYVFYRGVACDVTTIEHTAGDLNSIDTTLFINLERLVITNNLSMAGGDEIDLSNNKLLSYVDIRNNGFTTGTSFSKLNRIIIDLDENGLENGTLIYASNNSTGAQPSNAARQAYLNLINKGWTITGRPPAI